MDITKIIARINLMGAELDSIVTNDGMEIDIRCQAGRLHFDLIEEYDYCVSNQVQTGMLRDLMYEYEEAIMEIYKKI